METKTKVITSSNIFVEQNSQMAIGGAEEFSSSIHSLSEGEVDNVDTFFAWKAESRRVDVSPVPRRDRNGKPYYWVGRGSAETTTGFKLPVFFGVGKLIEHSLNGVKINVSLDELMAVAADIIKSKAEEEVKPSEDSSNDSTEEVDSGN